jgi:hypothetical protein
MRRLLFAVFTAGVTAVPVIAGALTLQADDVRSNPEAVAKKAVFAAHITACLSPEKTMVSATAEGIVNGKHMTIPLSVIRLSAPGAFAVAREWPHAGTWVVTMIATNPEYQNYATSIVIPVEPGPAVPSQAKVFYHAPSADEVDSVLKQSALE